MKYKENYMSQLGIWSSIPDRPEHFHHRAVTDAVSDVSVTFSFHIETHISTWAVKSTIALKLAKHLSRLQLHFFQGWKVGVCDMVNVLWSRNNLWEYVLSCYRWIKLCGSTFTYWTIYPAPLLDSRSCVWLFKSKKSVTKWVNPSLGEENLYSNLLP